MFTNHMYDELFRRLMQTLGQPSQLFYRYCPFDLYNHFRNIPTLLFYLKLYILSCVMIKDRSCAQLYLLNFTTLQLIITTSMVAKRNKSDKWHTIDEVLSVFLVLVCVELVDHTRVKTTSSSGTWCTRLFLFLHRKSRGLWFFYHVQIIIYEFLKRTNSIIRWFLFYYTKFIYLDIYYT